MHSSSSEGSAAEARESGLSAYNGNRKTNNYAQRKPPLADSREAYILGKYTHSRQKKKYLKKKKL